MLTRTPHSRIASREWQDRYAACPSVLTIPWRTVTVSQGRSAPA
jgi:hypothetical protein